MNAIDRYERITADIISCCEVIAGKAWRDQAVESITQLQRLIEELTALDKLLICKVDQYEIRYIGRDNWELSSQFEFKTLINSEMLKAIVNHMNKVFDESREKDL
jgi:hypothetical protein